MVRKGEIGPVMLGRDHHDTGGTDSPFRGTSNIYDCSNATADMAVQCYAGNAARGMSLVALHNGGGVGTGRLSAYCGAVSAGVGAGAGIAYLSGASFNEIAHTIVNAVAIVSGIICDGAKASCAAKISQSTEAGILGYDMYCSGNQFYGGDGIVKKGVENTIRSVGRLAHDGMAETDKEIIDIMLNG